MSRRPLHIGLVNNMPDTAVRATERQFTELLRAASPDRDVRLHYFAVSGVARGETTLAYMSGRYANADSLPSAGLDAVIVTGAEPRAGDLSDEPFWPALSRLIDWVDASGTPAVWSCLAAHAAVLRLDGIRRHRLPAKLSGVFVGHIAGGEESRTSPSSRLSPRPAAPWIPAFAGMSGLFGANKSAGPELTTIWTPHSRENELHEAELIERGYRILSHSPEAGVDSFIRRGRGLSLFFQGHPEYDADTLLREYSRDVGRYLRGERETHPAPPRNYFDPTTLRALNTLSKRVKPKDGPQAQSAYSAILTKAAPQTPWRAAAVATYRAWLDEVGGPATARPMAKTG